MRRDFHKLYVMIFYVRTTIIPGGEETDNETV